MQIECVMQIVLDATGQCDWDLWEKANATPVFARIDCIPVLSGEPDSAFIGLKKPAEYTHQCGLTATGLTGEPQDLPAL